jgi:hypothetical protein
LSSLAREPTQPDLGQIPEMALHAGKHSLREPWPILDVEGRLDGRQVIWEGFGNRVIIAGDEDSCCLQHHLILLIYDPGDILRHPQCKNILGISHESKKEY